MDQIEVSIMGHSYILGCPQDGEVQLRQAVALVDREMSTIRDSGKLKARERIAVLAALNIAFEQLMAPAPKAPATTSTSSDAGTHATSAEDAAAIDRLVKRLDQVLKADGHLL